MFWGTKLTGKKTSAKTKTKTASAGRRSSSSRGTGNTGGKRVDKRTVKKKEQFYAGEILSVIVIFAALFLFLSNLGLLGKAGEFAGGLQKGLFGYLAYIFPVYLLFGIFYLNSTANDPFRVAKNISLAVIFVSISVICHLAFGTGDKIAFAELYRMGKAGELSHGAAGGALGGTICCWMKSAVGSVGTVLISVLLILIGVVIVTEKSIIAAIRKGAGTTARAARSGAEATAGFAREGSARIRERIEQGRADREMRLEAMRLQKAEVDPANSRFDLTAGNEGMAQYAGPIMDETEASCAETGAVPASPEPPVYDYEDDSVPFDESAADLYRSYEKILEGGQIDVSAAGKMGFAASNDDGYDESEDDMYLHRPLSPDEIIYPEEYEEPPAEESREKIPVPEPVPEEIPEDISGYLQPADPEEPSDEIPDIPFDLPEEHLTAENMPASIQETAPVKPEKSVEEAQAELDRKREEEKKKVRSVRVRPYQFPPVSLLNKGMKAEPVNMTENISNSRKLEETLEQFGVGVKVTNVVRGPRVTRYEMTPAVGVKVSRITSLADDIKLALAATDLRIEAPIPGKSAVGIEVPNEHSSTVTFRDLMETPELRDAKSRLSWGVGLDIQGTPVVGNIAKMPHLLISGTTGSGKSVAVNTIIMSILYRATPEQVRMILVDPKVVELSPYDGIPHLLTPVVTKPSEALNVLNKACAEMNRRYRLFKESNTRNIDGYNEKAREVAGKLPEDADKPEILPYILIVIDELAELMAHSKKDVENAITSLTQLARAAGIHLVVVTQRPSVDVVTGLIKSNIPSRVALRLPTAVDSRTILDAGGAESLLGNGDMLYRPGDVSSPVRVQGAYLSDKEVETIIDWIIKHNTTVYSSEWEESVTAAPEPSGNSSGEEGGTDDGRDPLFFQAGDLITDKKKASIGMLQRRFKIGFNRAARIMDELFEAGAVSDSEGTKERQILMSNEEFRETFGNGKTD